MPAEEYKPKTPLLQQAVKARVYILGAVLALVVFLSALLVENVYPPPRIFFPPAPIPRRVRRRPAPPPPEGGGGLAVEVEKNGVEAFAEDRVRNLLLEADRFFDGGNVTGAAELYRTASELDPGNVAALSGLGAADFMLGRFALSER